MWREERRRDDELGLHSEVFAYSELYMRMNV